MANRWVLSPGVCSWAMMASFKEYMQHTEEQYVTPMDESRDPMQWRNATFSGMRPSEGLTM